MSNMLCLLFNVLIMLSLATSVVASLVLAHRNPTRRRIRSRRRRFVSAGPSSWKNRRDCTSSSVGSATSTPRGVGSTQSARPSAVHPHRVSPQPSAAAGVGCSPIVELPLVGGTPITSSPLAEPIAVHDGAEHRDNITIRDDHPTTSSASSERLEQPRGSPDTTTDIWDAPLGNTIDPWDNVQLDNTTPGGNTICPWDDVSSSSDVGNAASSDASHNSWDYVDDHEGYAHVDDQHDEFIRIMPAAADDDAELWGAENIRPSAPTSMPPALLRVQLPRNQELYRIADYMPENASFVYPYEEMDCSSCSSLESAMEVGTSSANKRSCSAVADLDWLTDGAPPPKKLTLEDILVKRTVDHHRTRSFSTSSVSSFSSSASSDSSSSSFSLDDGVDDDPLDDLCELFGWLSIRDHQIRSSISFSSVSSETSSSSSSSSSSIFGVDEDELHELCDLIQSLSITEPEARRAHKRRLVDSGTDGLLVKKRIIALDDSHTEAEDLVSSSYAPSSSSSVDAQGANLEIPATTTSSESTTQSTCSTALPPSDVSSSSSGDGSGARGSVSSDAVSSEDISSSSDEISAPSTSSSSESMASTQPASSSSSLDLMGPMNMGAPSPPPSPIRSPSPTTARAPTPAPLPPVLAGAVLPLPAAVAALPGAVVPASAAAPGPLAIPLLPGAHLPLQPPPLPLPALPAIVLPPPAPVGPAPRVIALRNSIENALRAIGIEQANILRSWGVGPKVLPIQNRMKSIRTTLRRLERQIGHRALADVEDDVDKVLRKLRVEMADLFRALH